jgi:hypothetical protein
LKKFAMSLEEVDWEYGYQQINDCGYLFIQSIEEIEELTLAVEVHEAKVQALIAAPRGTTPWENLFSDARPIEVDKTCRIFQLTFERNNMISYTVSNESYSKYPEPPEEFTGKLLRVFSWSHLLEFTKQTTYACNELNGPLQHYELACLNHVLDVICTKPPRIAMQKREAPIVRPN